MSDNNSEQFKQSGDNLVDEDTQITTPLSAPNFNAAEATPVQPVIPVAPVQGEFPANYQQQPQVVYVAQPTVVQPNRSWGWIPAALVLLLVATIAGAFVGAELYKRSTYAESQPLTAEDVSPSDNSEANANKAAKNAESDSAKETKETVSTEALKSSQSASTSNGFAPEKRAETAKNNQTTSTETDSDENADETLEAETDENAENEDAEKAANEDANSKKQNEEKKTVNPAELKEQIKKVENKKDTENNAPPQRSLPNIF